MPRAKTYRCVFLFALLLAGAFSAHGQTEGDPGSERGFKPELVYDFNGFDTVNLSNGNLMATIPLGQAYPVSETLSYSFALRYTGNLWNAYTKGKVTTEETEPQPEYRPRGDDNAGLGWRVSFGELYQGQTVDYEEALSAPFRYRYVTPDGGSHYFWDTLHEPICGEGDSNEDDCDKIEPGVSYTRDGSYLRLRVVGDARIIEFPNGERHRFLPGGPSGLRLESIYTAASALNTSGVPTTNFVKFTYPSPTQWVIRDSHNREHYVNFNDFVVSSVELAAFNSGRATYTLVTAERTIKRPCLDAPTTDHLKESTKYFLDSLTLPSSAVWSFTYDLPTDTCRDTSATMKSATLPTKGRVEWTYQSIYSADSPTAMSVTQRSLFDGATEVGRKLYAIEAEPKKVSVATQVKVGAEWRTAIRVDEHRNRTTGALRGLPFTTEPRTGAMPNPDEHGRYLSSETYLCNPSANTCPGTPDRVTYVKYEMDQKHRGDKCGPGAEPCEIERNRRVVSTRTLYVSDVEVINQVTKRYFTDTNYSRFDGLGHYRQIDTDGNFADGNVRTTTTEYNAPSGTYSVDSNGNRVDGYITPSPFASNGTVVPWLLETYKESSTSEGGVTARRLSCFDAATGLLKRQHTLAGDAVAPHDLLAVFTRGAGGNLTREEYFGGDKQALPYAAPDDEGNPPTVTDLCTVSLPAHNQYSYRINHDYSNGVRNRTWYSKDNGLPMPFELRDDTIDANTGLVSIGRDAARVETTYLYDASGRLTDVEPPLVAPPGAALANTRYVYTNASDTSPATVTVTTGVNLDDAIVEPTDTVTTYTFDALGRLRDEKHLLPDDTWSVRRTEYDDAGRTAAVSEFEQAPATGAFTPSHRTEFSGYDAYGRVKNVKTPDGKIATTAYVGARLTTRTQKVATSENAETDVSTIEEVDAAGRLITVIENGTAKTTYDYDVGGRLATVRIFDGLVPQMRTFTYDRRGFLTTETHPESGTTSYEYDARGHVVKRTGEVSTTITDYDDAERVKTVKLPNDDLIKEFFYDRANANGDLSNGKLDRAKRYNRAEGLATVIVEEKHIYNDPRGLLTRRETSLDTGEKFSEAYTYDVVGKRTTLTYPTCIATCPGTATPEREITTAFSHGSAVQVGTYTSATAPITYHANGLLHTVRHMNADGSTGPLYTQTISTTDGMARPASITVTNFCTDLHMQPIQPKTVNEGQPANLTVSAPGATEYQWFEGIGDASVMIDGQNASTLMAPVWQNTTYWVRAGNGSCTVDSAPVLVSVIDCPGTGATITGAPATITSSTTATASVAPAVQGATYTWTVTNGTILSGGNSTTVEFRAHCTGTLRLTVRIQTSCSDETPPSVDIPIARFTATAAGPPSPIQQGDSTEIRAVLTGAGPWDLLWDDNIPQDDVPASPAWRTVTPDGTKTYKVKSVLDGFGCLGTPLGSAPVTVIPPKPTSLVASAVSGTRVNLSWAFTGLKDRFEIYRGGGYLASTTTTSYADMTAIAGTAYLYTVVAVKNETDSLPSVPDLATTVMFADDPVVPLVTAPSAQHLTQLRQAVNAVRRAAGLADASFTDSIATGTIMRAVHLQELGTALNQARSALGLPQLTFPRWPLLGKSVTAADVNDLRGGVK